MKLAVFNGSPRGMKSNTRILLEQMLAGYTAAGGQAEISLHYLAKTSQLAEQVQAYAEADCVILAFPLYTDSMPGIVMAFIEAMATIHKSPETRIGFLVQSGFPEAVHSVHVEAYLEKLTRRLGMTYLGTIIKGGVEGIQMQSEKMTAKLFTAMQEFGKDLAETGNWDTVKIQALRKPYRFGPMMVAGFKVFAKLGLVNFYWNMKLRENDAFDRRFDRPYQP